MKNKKTITFVLMGMILLTTMSITTAAVILDPMDIWFDVDDIGDYVIFYTPVTTMVYNWLNNQDTVTQINHNDYETQVWFDVDSTNYDSVKRQLTQYDNRRKLRTLTTESLFGTDCGRGIYVPDTVTDDVYKITVENGVLIHELANSDCLE